MTLKIRTDDIIVIMGMGGSGKTTFTKELLKRIRRHRIYDTSRNQYHGFHNYVPRSYNPKEFEDWCEKIMKRGNLLAAIEEAQNYFTSGWGYRSTPSLRMVKEGRNSCVGTVAITRRPQDLSTKFMDDANHVFMFKLVGRARDYMMKYLDLEKEDQQLIKSMKNWRSKEDHCFLHYQDGVLTQCDAIVL